MEKRTSQSVRAGRSARRRAKNAAKFNQEEYTIPPEKLEVGRGKCYNQCDRVVYPWDPARENRDFAFEKCMALEDRQWQIS